MDYFRTDVGKTLQQTPMAKIIWREHPSQVIIVKHGSNVNCASVTSHSNTEF